MPQALGLVETKGLVGAIVAADAMLKAANVTLIGKEKVAPALITIKIIGETAAVKSSIEAGAAAAQRVGQLISTHLIPHPDSQLAKFFPQLLNEGENISLTSVDILPTEIVEELKSKTAQSAKLPRLAKEKKVIQVEESTKENVKVLKVEKPEPQHASLFDELGEDKIKHTENTLARLKAEALKDLSVEEPTIEEEEKVEPPVTGERKSQQDVSSTSMEELETFNVHQLRKIARGVDVFPIYGREISRANRETLLTYFRSIKK